MSLKVEMLSRLQDAVLFTEREEGFRASRGSSLNSHRSAKSTPGPFLDTGWEENGNLLITFLREQHGPRPALPPPQVACAGPGRAKVLLLDRTERIVPGPRRKLASTRLPCVCVCVCE